MVAPPTCAREVESPSREPLGPFETVPLKEGTTYLTTGPTMMSFRGHRLEKLELPASSLWLLIGITAARQRVRLLTRNSPRPLAAQLKPN